MVIATSPLRLDEPDGVFSVLRVPSDHGEAAILAAFGIVAACPDGGDKARVTERLEAGDEAAVILACEILARCLGPHR